MIDSSVVVSYSPSYSIESDNNDCRGAILEIPSGIQAGDQAKFRLWGGSWGLLENYTLHKGTETVGAGQILESGTRTIQPIINFSETYKYQLDWPIDLINSIEAVTEIFTINDSGETETWATKGDTITSRFSRSGYSCIIADDRISLFGSIRATCTRSKWFKRWYWNVPSNAEGLYWFFMYKENMVLDRKFSIQLSDLTESSFEYRNIIIRVVDKYTGTTKSGAEVFIDDLKAGTTGMDGELIVNNIKTGEHSLLITGDDFINSDLDDLNNESFVVY